MVAQANSSPSAWFVAACLTAAPLVLPARALAQSPEQANAEDDRRAQALALLHHGESLLATDGYGGLLEMLEAYYILEDLDGAEDVRVRELRCWLFIAFRLGANPNPVSTLRLHGSRAERPLAVMPSTWFPRPLDPVLSESFDEAAMTTLVPLGFDLLTEGDVEGLALLLSVHELAARQLGAQTEATITLRSYLVGLLEAGGYNEIAADLRKAGSVIEPSGDDRLRYEGIWDGIAVAGEQAMVDVLREVPEHEAVPAPPTPTPYPPWDHDFGLVSLRILTSVNGGSYLGERRGVVGGDTLIGLESGLMGELGVFVVMPSIGWSGWRTLEKPSLLRANTFTARLDLGYFDTETHRQGCTVSVAGRIGTGRGPEQGSRSLLYGAAVGVMWWFYSEAVGVEFQPNFTRYAGAWHFDLRIAVTVDLVSIGQGIFVLVMEPGL
jgi:hypothetical protein